MNPKKEEWVELLIDLPDITRADIFFLSAPDVNDAVNAYSLHM